MSDANPSAAPTAAVVGTPVGTAAAAPAAGNAIELRDVRVTRRGVEVLTGVTADVPRGQLTAIIGPNGAGKTTLLSSILRLIPYRGSIVFPAKADGSRAKIAYVPQRLDFDRESALTVMDFMVMAHQRRPLWLGIGKRHRERAHRFLDRVEALKLADRPLGKLSGGELQRVQVAQALQDDPDVLLLDEPVAGIDVVGERLFCDILDQLRAERRLTMVMVSHDLSVVSAHASHVLCLNRTIHCAGPVSEVMRPDRLAAAYGPHIGLFEHHGHGHHEGCAHGDPTEPRP